MYRNSRITLTTIILAAVLIAAASTTMAGTLTVSGDATSCANANFTTIAGAISHSIAGNEIEICPGVYPEQIVILAPLSLSESVGIIPCRTCVLCA
jgi:hypothetical protein